MPKIRSLSNSETSVWCQSILRDHRPFRSKRWRKSAISSRTLLCRGLWWEIHLQYSATDSLLHHLFYTLKFSSLYTQIVNLKIFEDSATKRGVFQLRLIASFFLWKSLFFHLVKSYTQQQQVHFGYIEKYWSENRNRDLVPWSLWSSFQKLSQFWWTSTTSLASEQANPLIIIYSLSVKSCNKGNTKRSTESWGKAHQHVKSSTKCWTNYCKLHN